MQLGTEQMRFCLAELFFLTLLFFSYLTRYIQAGRLVRALCIQKPSPVNIYCMVCQAQRGDLPSAPSEGSRRGVSPDQELFSIPSQLQKLLAVI